MSRRYIAATALAALALVGCSAGNGIAPGTAGPAATTTAAPDGDLTAPPDVPTTEAVPTSAGPTTATFGQKFTFPDGFAVTIAKPLPYTPSQYAALPSGAQRAIVLTVTINNATSQPYSFNPFTSGPQVTSDSQSAQQIFDSGKLPQSNSSIVLPGKSLSYKVAYAAGASGSDLQAEWTRDYGTGVVIFTGTS